MGDKLERARHRFALWATDHPWQYTGASLLLIGAWAIVVGIAILAAFSG